MSSNENHRQYVTSFRRHSAFYLCFSHVSTKSLLNSLPLGLWLSFGCIDCANIYVKSLRPRCWRYCSVRFCLLIWTKFMSRQTTAIRSIYVVDVVIVCCVSQSSHAHWISLKCVCLRMRSWAWTFVCAFHFHYFILFRFVASISKYHPIVIQDDEQWDVLFATAVAGWLLAELNCYFICKRFEVVQSVRSHLQHNTQKQAEARE